MVAASCYRECMKSIPAPGEAESLALALVNSLRRDRTGLVDDIGDSASLDRWLTARLDLPADIGTVYVVAAQGLRASIRGLFEAVISGEPAPAAAVNAINEAAGAAPGVTTLTTDLTSAWRFLGGRPGDQLLARFAQDAIALTTGERARDLAACQAPQCRRLLLRDHNRRHWCGTKCGDRVRSARYHARHQTTTHTN